MIVIKSKEEINKMRQAGKIVADVLYKLNELVKPGVTTEELDCIARDYIESQGGVPTFLGYHGFPRSLCTSINEEVVHGIPSPKRLLEEGDIISVDCGVTLNGFIGDAAVTYPVGSIDKDVERLITGTQKSLERAITAVLVDNRIGDIGHAVQSVAKEYKLGVVRDFVGHGVGRNMHEEPQVPNFGKPGTGPRLRAGMVIAIEPMLNLGSHEVEVLDDKWTVVTKDRKWSAHFEHTIAVTEEGPEILTRYE
ncbi:MAG: type I methionyl aminopeptidase [bacterium]|nr:type I methionyl aminopeptidase [bacterium]MBU1919140.1 type I methionyl aminopeptidase [bacterium]